MAVPQRLQGRTPQLLSALLLSAAFLSGLSSPASAQQPWQICAPFEKRITCVVDGDTLWFEGKKMRLSTVDTPELDAECPRERVLAVQATVLLVDLLSSGPITITRHGKDRYDRTLVTIDLAPGTVAQALLQHGLADRFGSETPTNWCQ